MRTIAAWVAVSGLLLAGHIVGGAVMWALGALLLAGSSFAASQWWAWALIALVGAGSAIAFLFAVVGFSRKGRA